MALITSLVLAAFAGYVGAWYFGAIEGNFALLLFLATVVTGLLLAGRALRLPAEARAGGRQARGLDGRAQCAAGRAGHHAGRHRRRQGQRAPADAALVARLDGRPVPGDPGGVPAALVPVTSPSRFRPAR
jgi:hypothetical protein